MLNLSLELALLQYFVSFMIDDRYLKGLEYQTEKIKNFLNSEEFEKTINADMSSENLASIIKLSSDIPKFLKTLEALREQKQNLLCYTIGNIPCEELFQKIEEAVSKTPNDGEDVYV